MTEIIFPHRRQERRGTAAAALAFNETLKAGEWFIETDTGRVKVGDGATVYNSLPYATTTYFAEAAGTGDALTATIDFNAPLFDGMEIILRAAANNTGAATLALNGGAALDIVKYGGDVLEAGDIKQAGHEIILRYVLAGPNWELVNPSGVSAGDLADKADKDAVQQDSLKFAAAGGTADAITVTLSPVPTLADGMRVYVRASGANTVTNPTLNVNGLGALTIFKHGGQALAAADIFGAGHELTFVYRSSVPRWELQNPAATGGGGISDGDKGDIVVSGGGTVWEIDAGAVGTTELANGAVTLAKQANMATASVVYRKTGGAGAPEVQTLATLKTDLGLTGTNSGDQTRASLGIALGDSQAWTAAHSWSGLTHRNRIINTTTQTSVGQSHGGLLLEAVTMNTTNKYTAGLFYASSDANFTTTNPKILAGIVGYATENYTADDDGGSGLEFFALPNNPGVTPALTSIGTADTNGWDIDLASAATAVTQATSDDSTKVATTAFVHDMVAAGSGALEFVGTATVAGAAATNLTLSGLDLTADGRYRVYFSLKNATGSSTNVSLYYNADTTATNYYRQTLTASGTSSSPSRGNDAQMMPMSATTGTQTGHFDIQFDQDGKARANLFYNRDTPSAIIAAMLVHVWNVAGNVTGITFTTSVASALEIGSTFSVWKVNV